MALFPTVFAVVVGIGLGLANGGRIEHTLGWRPSGARLAGIGVALQVAFRILPLSGTLAVLVELVSVALLLTFCVANIRLGGMVVIVAGLVLNLVPTIVDWGMPVTRSALVSAEVVTPADIGRIRLEGPRHLERPDDSLVFLGDVIALPTNQVISLGDLVMHLGFVLTVSSLLRRRVVAPARTRRGPATAGSRRP